MALDYKSSSSRYRRYLQVVQSQPLWATSMWVIMSLILVIILTVMALRPTLITISGLVGQIDQQKEISRKLDEKIVQVRNALQNMEDVKSRIGLLDKALPNQPQWETMANDIKNIAIENNLVVESLMIDRIPLTSTEIKPSNNSNVKILVPTGVIPVRFTLIAAGEYDQIKQTIERIHKYNRLVMISQLAIDVNREGGWVLTVNGQGGYIADKL